MLRNRYSIGIILIAIAVVLLLGKVGVFSFLGWLLWPLLVLAAGGLLHWLYFGKMLPAAVVIPGGMLITYAVMFFLCNLFGWHLMKYIWPGFIFGVAVGLYEYQMFERFVPRGVMTASIVLAVVSAALFGMMLLVTLGVYFIVIGLLVVGIVLITRRSKTW
ncbi:hypothetical protein [Paenibacillus thalictri]|uniref:DUF5668 domain-containing protein n=1 Tax=Paenibacillus thalictri TaxID=2527873 RepID=A0A4Q9DRY0_9BACL|nr:hypothetical protein [Paenibacillus thalictri]TBL78116.1 hypothetical protein EYB31_14620 [Paenibacillus thalictri]